MCLLISYYDSSSFAKNVSIEAPAATSERAFVGIGVDDGRMEKDQKDNFGGQNLSVGAQADASTPSSPNFGLIMWCRELGALRFSGAL